MASDDTISVKITADASGLGSGLSGAEGQVKATTEKIQQTVASMKASLRESFAQVQAEFNKGFSVNLGGLKNDTAQTKALLQQTAAEAKKVFEATRTPAEKLQAEIKKLNALYSSGAIDAQTYKRAMDAAKSGMEGAATGAQALGLAIKSALLPLLAISTAIAAIKAFVTIGDEAKQATARLQQFTDSAGEVKAVQEDLFQLAQKMQVPTQEVQAAFTRLTPAIKEMGGSTREALGITEVFLASTRVAGISAAEAASSMTQFAQAMGSGVLQGDELKSILENNSVFARVLADSLGVTVGELKNLGAEGKLTSDVVANALLENGGKIMQMAADMPPTVGGALTEVWNATKQLIGVFDGASNATGYLAESFSAIAVVIEAVTSVLSGLIGTSDELGRNQGAATFGQNVLRWSGIVIDALAAIVRAIMQVISVAWSMASAVGAALSGDFSGALKHSKAAIDGVGTGLKNLGDVAKNGLGKGEFTKAIEAAAAKRSASRSGPIAQSGSLAAMKGGGGYKKLQSAGGGKEGKGGCGGKGGGGENLVSNWQAELDAQKLAYAEMQREAGTHYKYSAATEAAYWREKLKLVDAGSKDGIAIRKKILALEAQMQRDSERMTLQSIASKEAASKHALDIEQQEAEHLRAMGEINDQQRLTLQMQFEERRYQIALEAWAERRKLLELENDPEAIAANDEKRLELERQFQLKKLQLQQQLKQKQQEENPFTKGFDSIEGNLAQTFQALLTRTQTFRQAMRGLFQNIGASFAQMSAQMVARWVMDSVKRSTIGKMLGMQEVATQTAASTTVMGIKAGETTTVVGKNATQAASGAAAAMASIPYAGPALAMAAAAAMLAFVMGMNGGGGGGSTTTTTTRIPSARGGWDIPAGINPLTQLHEREMVLPAAQADAVRQMAEGGGGDGQSVVINTTGGDFIHKRDLAKLLKTLKKDYIFK